MRLFLAIAAAASVLGLAAPASAGVAQCLWDNLPAAGRESTVATLSDALPRLVHTNDFVREDLLAAMSRCQVSQDDDVMRAAFVAMSGLEMRLATERVLQRRFQIEKATLDAGWAVVAAEAHEVSKTHAAGTDTAAGDSRLLVHFAKALSLPNTDHMADEQTDLGVILVYYVFSRDLELSPAG